MKIDKILKENKNIAFIGGMGAGKTSLSKKISSITNKKIYSFGTEVKKIAKLYRNRELDKKLDRELMQNIGTLFRSYREEIEINEEVYDFLESLKTNLDTSKYLLENILEAFHPNYFVNKLIYNEAFMQDYFNSNVLIDDMRFINEYEGFMRGNNGIVILIEVPEDVRIERIQKRDNFILTNKKTLEDISEIEYKSIDYDYVLTTQDIDDFKG